MNGNTSTADWHLELEDVEEIRKASAEEGSSGKDGPIQKRAKIAKKPASSKHAGFPFSSIFADCRPKNVTINMSSSKFSDEDDD